LIKYFKKDAQDRWTANSDLMKNIEFRHMNLKSSFQFGDQFDLVFCRNVLIYQNVEGKIEILGKIVKTMSFDGTLVMGSGESLLGLSEEFSQTTSEGAVIYKRKTKTSALAA